MGSLARDEAGTPVTAETIRRDVEALGRAREKLRRRTSADIIEALDEVVRRWLAADSAWMREAEAVLATHTNLSPAMLRDGLPRLLEPLRGPALLRLLAEELGAAGAAAGSAPGLVAHILPGNVPALAAAAICLSLAVKAAALVKPAREERWFAPLFAASVADVDPELAACIAVRYWSGGAREVEDEVFAAADVVEVAGSDDAVAAVRRRASGRCIERGSRLSFAAIGAETLAAREALALAAASIAEDVCLWEQRGCLSPQIVLVETSSPSALEDAAAALGRALDVCGRRWPAPPLTLDEKASRLRFRQSVEWGLGDETGARVLAGSGWMILLERAAALRPTCLHRSVRLQPVADLAAIAPVIEPVRACIEAAGLAVERDRFAGLAFDFVAAGARRVCRAGEMQSPDLSWKPGGVARVAAWF